MSEIAILAGNPRVELAGEEIIVEPQVHAFNAGLQLAREVRSQVSHLAVVIDHIGFFEDQFMDAAQQLSNRKRKKRIQLSYLHPTIRVHYEQIAAHHGFSLDQIRVITKAQCTMSMLKHSEKYGKFPPRELFNRSPSACDEGGEITQEDYKFPSRTLFKFQRRKPFNRSHSTCDEGSPTKKLRVRCRAITAEVYRRLACHAPMVRAFWEFDDGRCKVQDIQNGINDAINFLAVTADIESLYINSQGEVTLICGSDGLKIPAPLT